MGFQETEFVMMFKAEKQNAGSPVRSGRDARCCSGPGIFLRAGCSGCATLTATAAGAPRLGWYKTCSKQEDNDVCVVQNVVLAGGGQLVTGVGLISVSGKINNKSLQVSVPPARLIPPGVTMQIDGGKGQKIDYLMSACPTRCVAQIPLTDAMVASLKKGTDRGFDLDQLPPRAEPDQDLARRLHRRIRWRSGFRFQARRKPEEPAGQHAEEG